MGTCCSSTSAVDGEENKGLLEETYKPRRQSSNSQKFSELDINGDGEGTKDEVYEWVSTNAALWAMLSTNLNLDETRCKEIATHVVISLATGETDDVEHAAINKKQFKTFLKRYVDDPKGSQEFFHRAVFAAFDENKNNCLDEDEFDNFLNIFYEAGSIFKGDARLPEKEELKKQAYEKLNTNQNGKFSFEEIRSLISGSYLQKIVSDIEKKKGR